MQLVDLRKLPGTLAKHLTDANEAVVDALLNSTWQRASGSGTDSGFVFGVKPSLRFVSGFLMPRFEDTGRDDTSDIHISAHGLDCQVAANPVGMLSIRVEFCVYVRTLPSWDELNRPELELFPNPPVRKELETAIRALMKERLAVALDQEKAKPPQERRDRRHLQQHIYRDLLAEHGVEMSEDALVAESAEPDESTGADAETGGGEEPPRLAIQRGRYLFRQDSAAQEIDVPQKWKRLAVVPQVLSLDLAHRGGPLASSVGAWNAATRSAVTAAVTAWIQSEEGRDWAYRPTTIRPSHFRSAEAWNAFLESLRVTPPAVGDLAPDLSGLSLAVEFENDLRDADRLNLRVVFENNSTEVGKRRRHRFDHSVHQVGLHVTLPAKVHRSLRLDRVEASYRFRDFLFYDALGINCGVTTTRDADNLVLSTTWMPRYQQPRIVPTAVPGMPTEFEVLAKDDFDPESLQPFVKAYQSWIETEQRTLDPAAGVPDPDQADRERERFKKDIEAYQREVQRVSLGIRLLAHAHGRYRQDPTSQEAYPFRAWLLLNKTFKEAGAAKGITGWRLFQLAFVLAHIPTVASRSAAYAKAPWFDPDFDEETATLLYFPTGGGKSEAFFGLLVFTLFFDRLRGKNVGITALIRYPLRLLTLQQAQRLLAILLRAELLRREHDIGTAPFEIGFWVGSGNTPNKSDDPRLEPVPRADDQKHKNDDLLGIDYREANESFNKIPKCPLCAGDTGLRRISGGLEDEIGIFCFDSGCRWNKETQRRPLPFLIIDRDIYAHAPAVLLGVIDKLALIGQHPATINRVMGMLGFARWRERGTGRLVLPSRKMLKDGPAASNCEPLAPAYEDGRDIFHDPFPSLIIQDEAHLLDESLGTFAGLFETMLERLLVRASALLGARVARSPFGDQPARLPKIVAATATVSVPQQQFGALYQRRHMHFPYPGTSIYRSFYANPASPADPGRRGIGGRDARAPEIEAPWMRVYASIMTNGKNHTVTTVGVLAAYHLAITELWEDLFDPARQRAAADRLLSLLTPNSPLIRFHADALAAFATGDFAALLTIIDLMRISLTYVTNKKGGDQVIDAFREEVAKVHARHGRVLTQLHTKLISGGIDVAQIQSIMREAEGASKPGQPFPDLQQSLRNIVATSAISHGVDVDNFNAMFFAGMPNDIAEFIQASSRVGRTHVGFSLLIPTPQSRRDRYIVETHDVFNRFLERMIAPPAITRWAASAHDRILTSLFQAWLSGWAEQKLFIDRATTEKERALSFETVADVGRLLAGDDLPGAAKDFMEFAVEAIGVEGRGVRHIGAAPHADYYDGRMRNLAKQLTDDLRAQFGTTRLSDYWSNAPVGQKPMMSLRDIDEAGHFVPSRPFGTHKAKGEDEKKLIVNALRIVRRQRGSVGELDSEDGEA